MNKRISAIIIAMIMGLSLIAGCGGKEEEKPTSGSTTKTKATVSTAAQEPTAEPTEEPETEPTDRDGTVTSPRQTKPASSNKKNTTTTKKATYAARLTRATKTTTVTTATTTATTAPTKTTAAPNLEPDRHPLPHPDPSYDLGDSGYAVSVTLTQPANNATNVKIANDQVLAFYNTPFTLTAADPFFSLSSDRHMPADVTFRWTGSGTTFQLLLAEHSNFCDAVRYTVNGKSVAISGLKGGTTYYWKVWGSGNVKSETFSFTTMASPRTVTIEGVKNSRDIGGWKTEDGGRIRQGQVYRTGRLNDITPAGIDYCLNVLGIKTELDLREAGEQGAGVSSSLGKTVNYVNVSSAYYAGDHSIYLKQYYETMRKILLVFADKNNYPILFHCTIGRDRTGTVAFLLESLCGAQTESIYRDYDLSCFSSDGDNKPSLLHANFFTPLVKGMKKFEDSSKSLSWNAGRYMLAIGLTPEQIRSIKNNLLEYGY